MLDPTNTSEDGEIQIQTVVAGILANRVSVGNGLLLAGATGGYQGNGTGNFTQVYDDGVALPTGVADAAGMESEASSTLAVPPSLVKRSPGVAKAWCLFNGLDTTATGALITGYNVNTVTRTSAGRYRVNFVTAFSSANYVATAMGRDLGAVDHSFLGQDDGVAATASMFPLSNSNGAGANADVSTIRVVFFGDMV